MDCILSVCAYVWSMLFCYDMIRILLFPLLLCFWSLRLYSLDEYNKTTDKILMKIGDSKVYLSEFESMYSNIVGYTDCSRDEYFHYFSRYKLKAFDAVRLGLGNTVTAVKYKNILSHIEGKEDKGAPLAYLLTFRIRQDEDTDYAIKVMEGVITKLKSGFSLSQITDEMSDKRFSCDEITDDVFLLEEVRKELNENRPNIISKAFMSPEGVHVLVKYFDKISTCHFTGFSDCLIMASLWDEYYRENLRNYTEKDLEKFFRDNRKKYIWEFPHFRGIVIHCKNKKAARKIRRVLKKKPEYEWKEVLGDMMRENSDYDSLVDYGLFQIGENEYVDKLVFKCGDYKIKEDYPYTFTLGKCLDCMPERYTDVYDVLLQDYYLKLEDLYFERLERDFRVEKYIDVLKTVNSDGSN